MSLQLNCSGDEVSSGLKALLFSPQLTGWRVVFDKSRPQFIKGQSNLYHLVRKAKYYNRFKELGFEPNTP
jgi:hypothetical protein